MTAHTPGPWEFTAPSDDSPRFFVASTVTPERELLGVGEVYACLEDSDGEQAECEANARLIAAAPDMLAALYEARDQIREFLPTVLGTALTQVEAAIAKAEGRS